MDQRQSITNERVGSASEHIDRKNSLDCQTRASHLEILRWGWHIHLFMGAKEACLPFTQLTSGRLRSQSDKIIRGLSRASLLEHANMSDLIAHQTHMVCPIRITTKRLKRSPKRASPAAFLSHMRADQRWDLSSPMSKKARKCLDDFARSWQRSQWTTYAIVKLRDIRIEAKNLMKVPTVPAVPLPNSRKVFGTEIMQGLGKSRPGFRLVMSASRKGQQEMYASQVL